MRATFRFATFLLITVILPLTARGPERTGPFFATDDTRLAVGRIDLPLRNDGDYGGFGQTWYPPAPSPHSILFAGGPLLSGRVNGEIRTAWMARANRYEELRQGQWGAESNDPRYRFYRVEAGDGPGSPAYVAWSEAVAQGAAFDDRDGDGRYDPAIDTPGLRGEAMLWCVYNDSTTLTERNRFLTAPMNIEIRQRVWSSGGTGTPGNTISFHYTIVNRGGAPIDSVRFSVFQDADIGERIGYTDDLIACDTALHLGYAYNDGDDPEHGLRPPAAGVQILQGPVVAAPGDTAYRYRGPRQGTDTIPDARNLPMTGFAYYIDSDPTIGEPNTAQQAHWYQTAGIDANGNPIDPRDWGTGGLADTDPRYFYSGDPVSGSGWRDDSPDEKRFLVNSGAFHLPAGGTQEIIVAYIAAQGESAVGSVALLKERARLLRRLYAHGSAVGIHAARNPFPTDRTLELNAEGMSLSPTALNDVQWTLLARPAGSAAYLAVSHGETNVLHPDSTGLYRIAIAGTFADGAVRRDTVVLTGIANRPPDADLTLSAHVLTYGDSLIADASGTSDPDGDPLAFAWTRPDWLRSGSPLTDPRQETLPLHVGDARLEVVIHDGLYVEERTDSARIRIAMSGLAETDAVPDLTGIIDMVLSGEHLFVLTVDAPRLRRYSAADLSVPPATSEVRGQWIRVDGNRLVATDRFEGAFLYDLAPDGTATLRDSIPGRPIGGLEIGLVNDLLWIPNRSGELTVWDIAVSPPQQVAAYPLPIFRRDVAFDGDRGMLFSSHPFIGLVSFDMSDPQVFRTLDTLSVPDQALEWRIAFRNDRVLLHRPEGGDVRIVAIDASDLTALRIAGERRIAARTPRPNSLFPAVDLSVDGLAMIGLQEGLRLWDYSDPAQPADLAFRLSGYTVRSTIWRDSTLFLAIDGNAEFETGLRRLRYDPALVGGGAPAVASVPDAPWLGANYPNPFNPSTRVEFGVGNVEWVVLTVFDVLGRKVRTLVNGRVEAGRHTVRWDGRSDAGLPVASGVYIYRLDAGGFVAARKMLLVR